MKLFTAALLVVFCAGAALARPEESAAPAEQTNESAAPAVQPKEPVAPAVQPTEPSAELSEPAKKPTRPASILGALLDHVKEVLGNISNALTHSKGSETRVAASLGERKKRTIAKIDKLKALLQAKDKSIVVPPKPKNKRDAALLMKAAISKAIKELDNMRAEIMKLK